uniref:Protein-L-isoaspartate O-methyltransferase n=1 Tax=uncultured Thiotrichaceae bacterium TaxID=298394 RepID=A0A6S6UM40_9GAMM|nr:MAG: Protein-L-isoaspartate O-methyltransferase (EC [uncultured Thiotrichaceae bacterium]
MNPEHARFNMVEQQIRPWGVLHETVLNTFRFLPREKFVLPKWKNLAFADIEIPIDKGQTMMHPRVEARMLQELAIQPTDHCLEIGTGSGFVTACLAHLGQHVDSVELYSKFSHLAEARLNTVDITNFDLYNDDASQGWQGNSDKQYDVIAVTGSTPEYVTAFEERLNIGGRLFIISGKQPAMHALLVTREDENEYSRTAIFETSLKPLLGSESIESFEF